MTRSQISSEAGSDLIYVLAKPRPTSCHRLAHHSTFMKLTRIFACICAFNYINRTGTINIHISSRITIKFTNWWKEFLSKHHKWQVSYSPLKSYVGVTFETLHSSPQFNWGIYLVSCHVCFDLLVKLAEDWLVST